MKKNQIKKLAVKKDVLRVLSLEEKEGIVGASMCGSGQVSSCPQTSGCPSGGANAINTCTIATNSAIVVCTA